MVHWPIEGTTPRFCKKNKNGAKTTIRGRKYRSFLKKNEKENRAKTTIRGRKDQCCEGQQVSYFGTLPRGVKGRTIGKHGWSYTSQSASCLAATYLRTTYKMPRKENSKEQTKIVQHEGRQGPQKEKKKIKAQTKIVPSEICRGPRKEEKKINA